MSGLVLTVSEIRAALLRHSGFAKGPGAPSHPLLGAFFHDAVTALVNPSSDAFWGSLLDPTRLAAPQAPQFLREHLYDQLLAPFLTRQRLALATHGQPVLHLWQAMGHFCEWWVGVLRAALASHLIHYLEGHWQGLEQLIRLNYALRWQIQPELLVQGEADVLFHDPSTGNWCVVELKLGAGSPEADLAQACLYHRMLAAELPPHGQLAVLSFQPHLQQHLYSAAELQTAQSALEQLILSLAQQPAPTPQPEYLSQAQQLVETCRHLGLPVQLIGEPLVGPTFVRYRLLPGPGVTVRKLTNRADDIHIHMALPQAPILQIHDGHLAADLPRTDPQTVLFSSVALPDSQSGAQLLIGIDVTGQPHYLDLADSATPHLLVAGTTGSGKTEFLRSALASLIAQPSPTPTRLVLIDPKGSAFHEFQGSRHLWHPDSLQLSGTGDPLALLDQLTTEMERRYTLFAGLPSLADYNQAHPQAPLPRLVFCCDEFADLVALKPQKDAITPYLKRLGQKARAAGIHLILATQRPERTVVDGLIKANLPARVCLKVTSSLESRIILDQPGAELLTGRGDLLFKPGGNPLRLQSPLIPRTQLLALLAS